MVGQRPVRFADETEQLPAQCGIVDVGKCLTHVLERPVRQTTTGLLLCQQRNQGSRQIQLDSVGLEPVGNPPGRLIAARRACQHRFEECRSSCAGHNVAVQDAPGDSIDLRRLELACTNLGIQIEHNVNALRSTGRILEALNQILDLCRYSARQA